MRSTLETRVGMALAVAVLVVFSTIELVGSFTFFTKGVRVSALFNTVHELKLGDPVKMAGVNIGRVESIRFDGAKVKVILKIAPDAAVRTDSTAVIRFAGLLGQNFVALDFGNPTSPRVEDGSILVTTEQPDLGAILTRLDNVAAGIENLTKTFTGDKIENLLGPLSDFVKESREPLTATFANLKTISTQIAEGKGTVGKLLMDDAFYTAAYTTLTNLQSAGEDLRLALADATKLVHDISSGKGSVGPLLTQDAMYTETTNCLANLREVLEKFNKGSGTLSLLVNDPSLYKNAKYTIKRVDKATESLEDQGVLTVLGLGMGKVKLP